MKTTRLSRIYDTPESALALAQVLASPERLQAFLRCLQERAPTSEDHAEAIRRARVETLRPHPCLSAPTASLPVVALDEAAATLCNPT